MSVYVGLTEMGVAEGREPHPSMKDWRFYRIEYVGFNEACAYEGTIWLPPTADPEKVEALLEEMQHAGT